MCFLSAVKAVVSVAEQEGGVRGVFVHCREKEEGLPLLEKAVDAVGQKDVFLGCFYKRSQLVIPDVGKSASNCSDTWKRRHARPWVSPWVVSRCVGCTVPPHRPVGKG